MHRRDSVALGIVGAVLLFGFLFGFAGYPLLEPDEGRNAEVAREMAITNDYVLPRLNGLPYLDKPIVYFAAVAVSMEVFGPTELAARLPSLLFTIGMLVIVWWFGRRHFDAATAVTAVVATAATPFTLAYSRTVIFDSALTFFMVVAILSLFEAIETPGDAEATASWWRAGGWAAIALGVLTKGPIALALPLLVCIPYAVWRRRVKAMVDATSLVLFVALVLPWVFAISREIPNFLRYVVVTETAARLTSAELGRAEPWWYFIAIMPAAVLPWSLVLAGNGRQLAKLLKGAERRYVGLFLFWIFVPFVFFTLSMSKRPQYMLPLVPAVAFLGALSWRSQTTFNGARIAAAGLAMLGVFLIGSAGHIARWVVATETVEPVIPATALALGIVCVAAAVMLWLGRQQRSVVLLGLALPIAAIPVVGGELMKAIGADRSARALAHAIEQAAGSTVQVVSIETLPLSLPFYLRQPIVVATDDGDEWTSNYLLRNFDTVKDAPTVRPAAWWREALVECRRPRVFVTSVDNEAARATLSATLPLIATSRKYDAYGPCGLPQLAGAR